MYETRIKTSGIRCRPISVKGYSSGETAEIPVITEKITPQQSLKLLVKEGCINVNFEMPKADFDAALSDRKHGRILGFPLSDELKRGFKFGEPRGEFERIWMLNDLVEDPENVLISARINIAEGLEDLLRRAGF